MAGKQSYNLREPTCFERNTAEVRLARLSRDSSSPSFRNKLKIAMAAATDFDANGSSSSWRSTNLFKSSTADSLSLNMLSLLKTLLEAHAAGDNLPPGILLLADFPCSNLRDILDDGWLG